MAEVLLFSDLHLHPHKRSAARLEDCVRALEWVFDVAAERDIGTVLFGGDLFHDRQKIEVYTYQRAFETLDRRLRQRPVDLFLLLGNHDLWYGDRTSVSSVVPLSALPGVRVIAEPQRIRVGGSTWDFIPFTHNPVAALEQLRSLPGEPEYCLGHIALDGAVLHGTHHADVSVEHDGDMVPVSASLFDAYRHTFLGHYHAEQLVTERVEYIGSPLQLSFGEAFQDKHLIAFDGPACRKTYLTNTFSPKHLVLSPEERDRYDLEGNFVRIRVADLGATDLVAMRRELLAANRLGSLEIKQFKSGAAAGAVKEAKAMLEAGDDLLARYVTKAAGKLDPARLLRTGKEICGGVG